ncbi:MAG: MoaD/ThiS family protein [Candidatus Competibacteraceae bacterium]|nr:MoaD/ThiS family protein [Candidatus Competibacteraceae bacterium]
MQITIKLYAMLADYLPPGAIRNASTLELDESETVDNVISRLRLPRDLVHLVLVNGVYVAPEQRTEQTLNEQDALAIWPPVAGG